MKRSDFIIDVFKKIGASTSGDRIAFGVAWAAIEDSTAHNNPLDTTEPWANATEFNSVGVKNYATWEDGIDATVATLKNGYYTHLLNVLRTPEAHVQDCINALNGSPWGSHVSIELYHDVVNEWGKYDTEVAGSPTPTPVPVPPTKEDESPKGEVIDSEHVHNVEVNSNVGSNLPVIKLGSTGRPVIVASAILNVYLNGVDITNEFDKNLEEAVKSYQQHSGLNVDGIIGKETWTSFFI